MSGAVCKVKFRFMTLTEISNVFCLGRKKKKAKIAAHKITAPQQKIQGKKIEEKNAQVMSDLLLQLLFTNRHLLQGE